jgi:hypothetical protein
MHYRLRQNNGKEYEKFQFMIGGENGKVTLLILLAHSALTLGSK